MPPFNVEPDQVKKLQTFIVMTDADYNWSLNFMLNGNDEKMCPFLKEVRFYEMRDHTMTR